MAKRATLDDKLAAIRLLRDQPASPEHVAELRKALGDKSNLIVAVAASIAGDQRLTQLAPDLVSAFDRFLIDPLKTDKLCRAKLAIVQALEKQEHAQPETFQKAARHVQFEPVWGGEEDTAPPLRAAGLIGLTRIDPPGLLPMLVEALTDPEREVRITAALSLGAVGSEAAGLLLRLKCRVGDREPEVLSECLYALLTVSHQEHLEFVTEFLDVFMPDRCEAAVLALGKSRLPEALEPLQRCWERAASAALREPILLAVAMIRAPAALDYLLDHVAGDDEPTACAALTALKIHRHDAKLVERIARLVLAKGNRSVQSQFDHDFGAKD